MSAVLTVEAPGREPCRVFRVGIAVQITDPPATFGCTALPGIPRMRDIVSQTARRHGVSAADLIGPSRKARFARPRQEAMWLCRQVRFSDGRRRYSYPQIGMYLGARDHTTVMWGERRHQERLDKAAASRQAWEMVA